ncbi:hypothetical protein B9Z55_026427 [Caenorhabditis nigoni]|uniref:Integrase catalytic domain-containing protein n=1 Tax=Caenorhabditis nigoni TaxID=1611254 RepID=A0A2G5T3I2_9PELO|nr:hypothetical protein B9Z55_026427 [Caenorhabditis nigoni]
MDEYVSPTGVLRSQIGAAKGRLLHLINTESEEIGSLQDVEDSSEKEVLDEIVLVTALGHRIQNEVNHLERYDTEWTAVIAKDRREQKYKDGYITNYGEYTNVIAQAKLVLKDLETKYRQFVDVHKKLSKVPVTYPSLFATDKSSMSSQAAAPMTIHTDPITIHVPSNGQPTVVPTMSQEQSVPPGKSVPTGQFVLPGQFMPPGQLVPPAPVQSAPPVQSGPTVPSVSTGQQMSVEQLAGQFSQNVSMSQQPQMVSYAASSVPYGFESMQSMPSAPCGQSAPSMQPMGYPVHPNGQSFYQYSYTAYDPPLLPPSIPTFNGDPIQYQPFIELFSSMVDIPRYQFCTRLRYLNQALQGEAKSLIQHLPLVESNYYAARKIIHDRYGNPVPVRHKLFCQLQDLPDMKLSPNVTIKDVSKFHTDASSIFYALRNIDPETDNSTIADMLMRKLPEKFIAFLVTGRNANRRYTASLLLEVLNSCIQEKSLVATYCEDSTNHSAGSKKTITMSVQQSRPLQQNPQKSGGRFAQRSRDNQVKTPCAFCSDTANYHRHAECPVYKTVEERTKKAQQERLCFKCLIHGHRGNNCPRSRPCFHCRGGHHTALCSVKDHVTPSGRQQPQGQPQGNRPSFKSNKPQDKKFTGPRNPSPRRDNNFQQKRVQFANTSVVTSSDTGDLPMGDDEVAVSFTTSSIPLHVTTLVPAEVPENATPDVQNSPPCIPRTTDKSLPVAMMTAQVMVDDEQGEPVKTSVFFDNGSDRSYIHRQLAENLHLEALDSKHLLIQKFAEKEATATNSNRYVVTFNIKDKKIPIILTETPMIANSLTSGQLNEQSIRDLLHDATAILPRTTEHPEILIGLDYMGQILGNTTSTRLPNGTTIHSTDCGFIITGTENQQQTVEQALETTASFPQDHYYCSTINVSTSPEGILSVDPDDEHAALKSLVERLWSLDSAGIFDNPRTTDEEITAKFFADTTTRDDTGRYVCRWPYKNDDATDMPDNRYLALHRLESTSRRLSKDMKLYQQYGEIIEEQLRREFIEIVEDETAATGRVHYLSHHPIIKQSSQTTKVRIVYDASARSRKGALSLNEMLHTGESLLPQLHGILMRCRQPQILISSDIEKAFLMLGLHEEDRDVTRFLWKPPGQDKILCYRFRRVPFGIKTSPYLLNATIKLHLSNINNPMANTMIRNIYVDNVFYGVDSVAEGLEFYTESRKMFDQAKMNLTQFMSNSDEFDRRIAAIENREMNVQPNQKLLGVCWNTALDILQVGIPPPIKLPLTKRRILQHVASAFDPIGLIAPVTIKGKLYFQTLWSASKNWDSPLTAAEVNAWRSIDICGEPIIVRRRYFTTPTTAEHVFELHIFGDASDLAYGSVAYLRRIGKSSKDIVLLTAKARVSPLKKALTIPTAELLAIERCCQLAKTLIEELDFKIKNVYIWSDSMCCLDQIASQQARTTYGRNRLRNINQLSPPDTVFTHIAGKLNPADVLSRGCALEFLRNYELWWNPFFLLMDQLPIKTSSVVPSITAMSVTEVEELLNLDPHRFSSFVRMFNVIARIINLVEKDENAVRLKATRAIVKLAQQLNPPCEQTIKNLSLDKDNGLWYFQGRIPQRRVYFLPAHHIAKLYVQHVHRLHKHSSVLYTMAKVRNEVWIPKGQSFIKKIIRDCHLCQVIHARPTYQPDFPNLPSIRITWSIPFTICGMDYAGPINATNLGNTRKYWFLVYTCLTTRYTVIDLVCSMDADQLLCSLRRMCSQYGTPQEIRTDNGSQFKMLSKVMLEAKHQLNTSHKLPVFRFIAALSPWSGGVHERMVGLVKRSLLRAGTTKRLLSEEDLRTLLKEVEAVINDRPLTYVSDTDISPIRPVDFVFPNKRQPTVLTIEETLDPSPLASTHQVLLEGWMSTSSIINDFIRRWKEEYVQILQSRTQTVHQQSGSRTFRNRTFRSQTFRSQTFRSRTFRSQTFRSRTFRSQTFRSL